MLSPARRLIALKALPGLSALPPRQLLSLGRSATVSRAAGGELLQEAGVMPERSLLVASGSVRIERDGEAPEVVRPFELVGGWAVLAGEPTSYAAVAAEPTTLLGFEVAEMEALIVDAFDLYRTVLQSLAHALVTSGGAELQAAPSTRVSAALATAQREEVVARLPLVAALDELGGLPLHVAAALAKGLRRRRVAAGEVLWEPEERKTHALIALDPGLVASFREAGRSGGGRPVPPGRLLGFEEALSGDERRYRLVARRDATVLELPRRILLDELEDDPRAARAFLREIARRVVRRSGLAGLRHRRPSAGTWTAGKRTISAPRRSMHRGEAP